VKKAFLCAAVLVISVFSSMMPSSAWSADIFNFKKYLFESPSTLSLFSPSINTNTGEVTVNGIDSRQPSTPFTFDWGDGTSINGWFPQSHTYVDKTRNYVVIVTSHYTDGTTDKAEAVFHFTSPKITPISLPSYIAVTIPDHMIALQSRLYGLPLNLTYFNDSFFTIVPRSTIEYVLTAAASIQNDFVNDNVFLFNNKFEQVALRDSSFQGMYSLWFTNPVSFGAGDYGFQETIQWSSFMHEMGHNFTLNTPSTYYYGGKIDGNANAIYSESMAQIFQHATTYEMINNYDYYGLSEDLTEDVKQSAISSITIVRNAYENYLNSSKPFSSWNDPSTPADETFDTFMTIAYKFFEHAENDGLGYQVPVKRMLELLQAFDPDLATRYDRLHNTSAAATFRATLMVTALSYAFGRDLREEFRSLNFPIDDQLYSELYPKIYPKISVSPKSLNFGSLKVGTTSNPETITIRNTGKGDLIINSIINIIGTNASQFNQTNNCSMISPGNLCTINVTFMPALPFGKKSAIISISSNDPKRPTVNVKLSGQAAPPKISVSPKSLNFGSVQVGNTSSPKIITIKNTSISDLVISDINITGTNAGEFNQTNECSTISPGNSCAINATFTPTTPSGAKSATISISSNDTKKPIVNVKIKGKAVGSGLATLISITVTPANSSIAVGATQQFAATGTYSDNTTHDITAQVTWSSSNTSAATVNSSGVATGVTSGTSTITAALGSISGNTTITVTAPPTLVSITGTPANPSITVGATQQFAATGTYSDNATHDITTQVTWSSSNTSVATVNTSGLATGVAPGTSTITATSGSISGNTTLTVASAGPTISSLSTTSASPMKRLTITGAGFDTAATLTVSFFDNNGFKLDVPVLEATTSSITVAVPPYINPPTGMFEPGTVNIRVLQNSTGSIVASNTLIGFQIGSLPTLTLPPGSVTANVSGFLELSLTDTINRLSELDTSSGGQIDTADLRAQLESIRVQDGQLKSKIRNAIANPGQVETIGKINWVPISLDQESLKIADQLMVAMINDILEEIQNYPVQEASSRHVRAQAIGCTQVGDPDLCHMEKMLTGYVTVDGSEQYTSQEYLQAVVPAARDKLAKIMNWFAAGAATIGAVAATSEVTIPLGAVAAITQVNVTGMVALSGMDSASLSANSNDKDAAKRLLDDFNGTLEFMRDSVLSPIIAAISEKAGILYDLYTGWKPVLEDKIPVFLTQLKTFINVGPLQCTYTYSDWSACQPDNTQTRTVVSSSPAGCTGTPVLSQSCTYTPTPVCGDGICDTPGGENSTNCPSDCTAVCGDGKCSSGEANTCPTDCQTSSCCVSTNNCPSETLYTCGVECCCCPYGSRCNAYGVCSN
jgi:hypothetical protein